MRTTLKTVIKKTRRDLIDNAFPALTVEVFKLITV